MNKVYYLGVALSIVVTGIVTETARASDYHSARTAALGGSGHAAPLLNDAIYMNPSFNAFLPVYSMGLNYTTYNGPDFSNGSKYYGRNYSVSLLDGRSELFGAGAAYTQREGVSFIHLGLAKSIVKRFGLGVSGKMYFKANKKSGKDAVFSATGVISEWIQAAFIVDNLLESDDGLDLGLFREFTFGSKFNVMKIVMVYLDPHYTPNLPNSDQRFGHELGLEFGIMSDLFLRTGWFRNASIPSINARGKGWGLGGGWIGPRMSLDYAYKRVIDPRHTNEHTFSATLYF